MGHGHGRGSAPRVFVLLLLLQGLLASAFLLPFHKQEPHDVPIGVVGTSAAVLELEREHPGAFDVQSYASEKDVRHAIDEREIYGALVVEGPNEHLLVASAASSAVAGLLHQSLAMRATPVPVTDVKPLVEDDPRGATLNVLFIPLVIACIPAVLLLGMLGLTVRRMIGALVLFAVLGGLAVVAIVHEGIEALPGSYVALSAIAALIILAIALPAAALQHMLGKAGVAVAGVMFILVANPASGNASAPELLPGFWRTISQLMPPGAGGQTLRNAAYFDGNAIVRPLLVLAAYVVGSLSLLLAFELVRRRRGVPAPAGTPQPVLP